MTLKPLVHYALFRKYKMRYTARTAEAVQGIFTTPQGNELPFLFHPTQRQLTVGDDAPVTLNDHGWVVNEQGEVVFKSVKT